MPKALRVVIALSITGLLFMALVVLTMGGRAPSVAVAQGATRNTLRVYGREHDGAGDPTATDFCYGRVPEDPPYTLPEPIFNPQLEQAPIKDSVTWNPLFMSEFETFDENHAKGLYNQIFAGARNGTEKVWFRMWYEPWHWDKDLNANGELDIDPCTQMPFTNTRGQRDEWYPAVMQEFTYMLLEAKRLVDKPEPLAGPVGQTSFVVPVGMRKDDLFTSAGQVDTTSTNARYGYGLTSLDGDFDGVPDIVHVESELTLYAKTQIAADFDGDGALDTLDSDATELNGYELAVLHLDSKNLAVNQAVQFLDHLVIVKAVFDDSALLEIWYIGDMTPQRLGNITLYIGDMLLSGRTGPGQRIKAVRNGGPGTNLCDFPTGPFFAYLENIDVPEHKARVMVGRALGATWSGMEGATASQLDLCPGDPWFLKRFYVDGHEYNVVAIKTDLGAPSAFLSSCDLDLDDNRVIDSLFWPPPTDPTLFKFITIRTPIPKWGEYEDPQTGYLIEQHSVRLQPYFATDYLSVMPPYNYEHYIIMDVQSIVTFTCSEEDVDYFGSLIGPVPPILQKNGPFPYTGVGTRSPYNDRHEMTLFYVEEGKNPQFLGELKEKYAECYPIECWYVEQWHTLPWEYTEFVLPDLSSAYTGNAPDLYLLTSSFLAPEMEAALWTQDVLTQTYNVTWDVDTECWVRDVTVNTMPTGWSPRAKFWFDPAVGGKKYKSDTGLRIYGFDREGPGDDTVTDPAAAGYPVEVWPYTDPWAPFNPQLPQAPPKDSLTFNPAYMDKFYNSGESLVGLYEQISIREHDAREKVFLRMWYEPEYRDKILKISPSQIYTFPALMQEFTYMYVSAADQPATGPPGTSAFAFPMATGAEELPAPVGGQLPATRLPSFGYGLTTFDANFDGQHDIVHVHSEATLAALTGIQADFNGNSSMDPLDQDTSALNGNEMVVFTLEDMVLRRGESVQFLDHMVTLDDVSPGTPGGRATLQFWYTGGGLHSVAGQYSMHPDKIGSPRTLQVGEMVIATRSTLRQLAAGGNNLGSVDGAWFVFVNAVNSTDETASLTVGRALGHAHSAMDDGNGIHDLTAGDPWYLKRFFVDGHEYNVVAVHCPVNPATTLPEFKYITIRTPVPKVNFINYQDSQKLEGYYLGAVLGVDTGIASVMPPFNFEHTSVEDVQALPEQAAITTTLQFVFGNPLFYDSDCRGNLIKNVRPFQIRIVDEGKEPQFFGELKEKYSGPPPQELWQTEQWHVVPDQYTELRLPTGQKYLLTSNWLSEQSRVAYHDCCETVDVTVCNTLLAPLAPNTSLTCTGQVFFEADPTLPLRVKFWYVPTDTKDVYVNTWQEPVVPTPTPTATPTRTPTPPPGGGGTITGTVRLQGRTNHGGVQVSAGIASTTTDGSGRFTLSGLPAGTYIVTATMTGYLSAQRTGVVVSAGVTVGLPEVELQGGDADGNCKVDIFDLVLVARNYGSSPPSDPRADVNGNGAVDIFDLVMVGRNLDKTCPGPWTSVSRVSAQAAAMAHLWVSPAESQGWVGQLLTVELKLEDVSNLYGADVQLSFDPNILEVVDAVPGKAGVQIVPGTFLDPAQGEVAQNVADNAAGTVRYALTLKSPAPPVNGNGTVCAIAFRAKALGVSSLRIIAAELADPGASPIPVVWDDGSVRVSPQPMLCLPLIFKSGQR